MAVAPGAPAALAEPVCEVRRSWIGLLFAANLGLWMAFFTPVQVLLPTQIADLGIAGKEAALGWVTGLGALVAIIVNPVAGALSDRSRPRIGTRAYGRRHVWTLGGAVVAAGSLVYLSGAPGIAAVALGWAGAQAGLNVMLATLSAAVPDRVPVRQRGRVSGWTSRAPGIAWRVELRRQPDFTRAWGTRFLVQLGNALGRSTCSTSSPTGCGSPTRTPAC